MVMKILNFLMNSFDINKRTKIKNSNLIRHELSNTEIKQISCNNNKY